MSSFSLLVYLDRSGVLKGRLGDGKASVAITREEKLVLIRVGMRASIADDDRADRWRDYEVRKHVLAESVLEPAEYERAIQELAREMGL